MSNAAHVPPFDAADEFVAARIAER